MTRTPYFYKNGKRKGAWSEEEDNKLMAYISRYGHWNWSEIPKFAGVSRCGKSCRLRWMNYLRPNMKRGNITKEEEDSIIKLHRQFGNKWSTIAAKLPGRSDNEIKNYWNTNLRKRAKQDQLFDTTPESCNPAKSKQKSIGNQNIEKAVSVEIVLATSSSESSSSSPSPSTWPTFGFENAGSFWTDPFLSDIDSAPMKESFDLAQAFSHDMVTDDEFILSTMNLYDGYHRQLQK